MQENLFNVTFDGNTDNIPQWKKNIWINYFANEAKNNWIYDDLIKNYNLLLQDNSSLKKENKKLSDYNKKTLDIEEKYKILLENYSELKHDNKFLAINSDIDSDNYSKLKKDNDNMIQQILQYKNKICELETYIFELEKKNI